MRVSYNDYVFIYFVIFLIPLFIKIILQKI